VVRRSGVRVAWQAIPRECARRDLADALVASLAGSHGDSITVGRRCERCGASNHGRPFVVGAAVHASISYAGDLVVVAVADSRRVLALGIDAERVSRVRHDLRGVITLKRKFTILAGEKMELILSIAPSLALDEAIERKWPRKKKRKPKSKDEKPRILD